MPSSFLNRPAIGSYLPGSSPLHRMHPLVKLTFLLVLAGVIMTARDYRYMGAAALLSAVGIVVARIRPGLVWREVKGMAWLLAFVAGGNALTQWSNSQAFSLAEIFHRSLFAVKLVLMAVSSLVVMHTTAPDAIAAGLPVRLFGRGRSGLALQKMRLIIMMVLQFTPQLFGEAARLRSVYRLRLGGARRSILQRARDLGDLLVSLVGLTLMRNAVLVDSMTMRGFTLDDYGRTSLDDHKVTLPDILIISCITIGGALCVWLNIHSG